MYQKRVINIADLGPQIQAVRRFNRFYTQQIGVLREGFLESPFSLSEVRVLYELAHRDQSTATQLSRELGLDLGYLSRILRGFERRGLVAKRPSELDRRQTDLSLTSRGREAFELLNERQRLQVEAMLRPLAEEDRRRLVDAMQVIRQVLDPPAEPPVPYILRPPGPGDLGWVVHRHGALYAQEYGWDERFEGLVAGIVAEFVANFDPRAERCWIAEREGENVGSVFLVRKSETVAKLRLLLVEPQARGLGIGKRLVDECIRAARQMGYKKMTLWTNDVLTAARAIYVRAGFQLVHQESHHSFGHALIGETWELEL